MLHVAKWLPELANCRKELNMKKYKITGMLLILALAVAGCASAEPHLTSTRNNEIDYQSNSETSGVSWEDLDATYIEFADHIINIEEKTSRGAEANDNELVITSGGTYILSGNLTGCVVVDAGIAADVNLVLNNVTIHGDENAAIYCKQAGNLIITLAEDSTNYLSDAEAFLYQNNETQEPDAVLFSKNDLQIVGSGSLTVDATFNNGIGTKDDLTIDGNAHFVINAANHGIRGRDSVTITGGGFMIQTGADGIQSNNDEDSEKGWILLSGGDYEIISGNDAVQAETTLTVSGGSYQLLTGGGYETIPTDLEGSYKGLKAGTDLIIKTGIFEIDSADDCIHANGNVSISNGEFTLTAGDDAVHADNNLKIADGIINIINSFEGIEAMTMTISGGIIDLCSTDDGINVAGGTDTEMAGRFGRDQFGADDGSRWLKIEGGEISIESEGDGIDINGSGTMTAGTVIIDGPTTGGNAPLDYDGTFEITGGTLSGTGMAGMDQTPGQESTQLTLAFYYTSRQGEGTLVELKDDQGETVSSFTSKKEFEFIFFSTPELIENAVYSIYTNGEKTADITLSDTVTSVSESGEPVSNDMHGMGGRSFGGPGMGEEPPEGRRRPGPEQFKNQTGDSRIPIPPGITD